MAASPRLVLVDGTALIYRAYFAIPGNLSTASGLPTNAIYGFALMFNKLFAGRKPDFGAVVFDAPGGTFRDEQYADYKADRAPMDDPLREQLPHIDELVRAHDFPIVKVPGYEADDVIGTLTDQAVAKGYEVLIVSGDKDFAQLIQPSVRMLDAMRDITYDETLVRKKWGVEPAQFVDLLALMGDKIDNIPGVPGIGKKGASQLLEAHGSLDRMLEDLTALPPRYRKALEAHRDQALLSRSLATVHREVPLEVGLQDLEIPVPDAGRLNALYRRLEFFSLLRSEDIAGDDGGSAEPPVRLLLDDTASSWLDGGGPISVAAVHDGPPGVFADPVGLALVRADGEAAYASLQDPPRGLAGWVSDPGRVKWVHDVKTTGHVLRRAGLSPAGFEADAMLASFLIEPTKIVPHRIDQMVKEYLHEVLPPNKALLGAGRSAKTYASLPPAEVAAHAATRARAVHALWPKLEAELQSTGQTEIYRDQERPLADVLARMEQAGILIDVEQIDAVGAELQLRLDELEGLIHELAGHPFNIGSTKQLSEVLFEELQLPVIKRTKTGYSTASDVLERLVSKHEIAGLLLEHRKVSKLISTYTNVLRAAVHPQTGRIHATYQQTAGVTGRLISTDPDLQRTPIRTPEGKRIRRAFIAPPGHQLISADWSQIELRILAHVSKDAALTAAFSAGRDVHAQTAAALFDVAPDAVDEAQRRVGKTVNFATIYGQGATALSQILGIARTEAQGHIDAYFELYSGVRTWLDQTIAEAEETGTVRTLLGRRRTIPELSSNSFMERQAGQRIAANTPIQGSAADLCKVAMLRIQADLDERGLATRMLMQIHDELVFEAPDAEVEPATQLIRHHMQTAQALDVPLVVDVGVGRSWGEAH